MVDLHCHVMFGWDDGADTLEESLAMLRVAESEGTSVIAATPHMFWSRGRVDPAVVRERVGIINEAAAASGLTTRVVTGMEMPAMWDAANYLFHGEVLTLNDTRAVLFEPPFDALPVRFEELAYQMRLKGFVPLLAHPERCRPFIADHSVLERMVPEDMCIQLTTTSLVGDFGESMQAFAWELLHGPRPVVIASDAHNSTSRNPGMGRARALVEAQVGADVARLMFEENPRALIEGKPVRASGLSGADGRKPGLLERVRKMVGR
jgi:protein-tyrosine phosphatase